MLGSTVAATDAAAVFAVLRGSTLRRRIARTLEGESGVNDPIAVLLVLGCIEAIKHDDFGVLDALWLGGRASSRSAPAIGLAVGALGVIVLRRVTLPSAGLYPVASVAFAGIAYGGATRSHGSGFLAVFLAGLVIGSASSPARRTIITFHEGLAWVAQLGALPAARPARQPARADRDHPRGHRDRHRHRAWSRGRWRRCWSPTASRVPERLMLGWAGLRGATPIVFATFPVTEGIAARRRRSSRSRSSSCCSRRSLQGLTIEPVARWLGVDLRRGRDPGAAGRAGAAQPAGRRDDAVPGARRGDAIEGHPVRELGLPREALLNVIVRGERAIPPRGSTVIQDGRPAARARAPGGRGRVPRADAPLAHRARSARPSARRAAPRSRPSVTIDPPVAGRRRRPAAPEGARRQRRDRAAAHAPRRAGRAGRARGRPLRRLPGRCWRSGRRASCRRSRAAGCATASAGRAGVVAGGRRRAGALSATGQRPASVSIAGEHAPVQAEHRPAERIRWPSHSDEQPAREEREGDQPGDAAAGTLRSGSKAPHPQVGQRRSPVRGPAV